MRVIDEIACFLNCSILNLANRLDDPQTRILVLKNFIDRKVQTTYLNKDLQKEIFKIGGITRKGANRIRAYGHLRSSFNVTISQHFYSRHRIRLRYPYLNCIIDRKIYEKDRFYPIEVLEFVDEESQNVTSLSSKFFNNVKISPPNCSEDEMEIYRGDLSQNW
ncbi:hypothetical protein Mgra_00004581 [Meloidogyne graminicola]|uniref:PAZ domain-containing protein n=1 Tax=Meloidogyne graminicola TaxID=189291 RepID=A0A8S9ZRX9_9BILA|nr:hypothetical protein Mgra_00004581 [Meloidogyne graminicola]